MPRKIPIPESDAEADAIWRDFEVATCFSEPALQPAKKVGSILGIHPAVLPALAEQGILLPAAENAVAAVKKYVLKEVVLLRGKPHLLRKVREIEVAWTAKKNAKGKRVRERAEPDRPELP